MKKVLTLSFPVKEDSILLGLKKRGFGEGNWNGFGGKIEEGETITEAAVRELEEECLLVVSEAALKKVAIIDFHFKDGMHLEVHAFFTRIWSKEPMETDEMKPQWFAFKDIPYEDMWEDDIHWLPQALNGELLRGRVWFDDSGVHIEKMEWEEVKALD